MCKTMTTNWKLFCERQNAKKGKNNGIGAAVTAEEGRVYHTPDGATYRSLDVAGGGMCAVLTLIALYMISNGDPYSFVFAAVCGEVTSEMRGYVQCLRGIIVHMSEGRITHLGDGEESAPFDDVVENPDHEIETKGMWRMVMLAARGFLDTLAMDLLAEYFGLNGFRVVRPDGDGLLVPCDYKGLTLEGDVHLAMYDGFGHFKALIREEPHPQMTERNADEPRVEQTESAPEVAAGADAEEPDAEQTESAPEVAAGVEADEPRVEQTESAPEVAAGADAEEPRVEQTEGDGWHVVGGSGGKVNAHNDEESNLLRFATGNQFIVLCDEEEDDGSENGEEADETREADRVEVGVDEGEEVDETYERMEPDGATADAHPKTRNRAGRRVAGRRTAQPSSIRGRAGRKYLKRCPARNGRVQCKRGCGHGRRLEPPSGAGFVRGGGRTPRDRKKRDLDGGKSGASHVRNSQAYWKDKVEGYVVARYRGLSPWTQQDLDRAISLMWQRRSAEERQQYEPEIKHMLAKAQREANGEAEPVAEEPSGAMCVNGEQRSPEKHQPEAMDVGGEQQQLPVEEEARVSPSEAMDVGGEQQLPVVQEAQASPPEAMDVGGEQQQLPVEEEAQASPPEAMDVGGEQQQLPVEEEAQASSPEAMDVGGEQQQLPEEEAQASPPGVMGVGGEQQLPEEEEEEAQASPPEAMDVGGEQQLPEEEETQSSSSDESSEEEAGGRTLRRRGGRKMSKQEAHWRAGVAAGTWTKEELKAKLKNEKRKKKQEERQRREKEERLQYDHEEDDDDAPCVGCGELFDRDQLASLGNELRCAGCLEEESDERAGSVGDAGAVEGDPESDVNGDTCTGATSGVPASKKSKQCRRQVCNRLHKTCSQNEALVVPKDDEQAERIFANYNEANEHERKLTASKKTINEVRNLTYLDITRASTCLDKGLPVGEDIWRKLEKEDYGLYGITTRREEVSGTKVTSANNKGEVVVARRVKGYNTFTIEWSDSRKKNSEYKTGDVLRDRDDGQGVVSLGEATRRIERFLRSARCMADVQFHEFITNNVKVHDAKSTRPLSQDKSDDIINGRKHAWEETEAACAVDMLLPNEIDLLKSGEDPDLLGEMKAPKSCFAFMGLDDYARIGQFGLIKSNEDFNSKHLPFLNHFVRGAQASFRLGRPISLASSMVFMSVNELPLGYTTTSNTDANKVCFNPGNVKEYSLQMRAVLAGARVKDFDGKGIASTTCQWFTRYPLYRLLDLSRIDGGSVCPSTEHSNSVSPTLRHRDAYNVASMLSSHRVADLEVFTIIDQRYLTVSREKRSAKAVVENDNEKVGFGTKWSKGRTHLVGSQKCIDGYHLLEELVFNNGIKPIMDKLPAATVDMCNDVLEMDAMQIGKHKTEDHFCPPKHQVQIESVVDSLIAQKVTRLDVSLFSRALYLADAVLTAALRSQDGLGQIARDFHRITRKDVHGNEVALSRCLLPRYFKNKKSLENSPYGVVVNHTKHEKCVGPYAVMVVILRKMMRRLLKIEMEKKVLQIHAAGGNTEGIGDLYALTEHLGPFDENGILYNEVKLRDLFRWIGKRAMGIPRFGTHIIRTNHATAVAMYCVRNGLPQDHQTVKDLFALARHGEGMRIKSYSQVKADTPDAGSIKTTLMGTVSSLESLEKDFNGVEHLESRLGDLVLNDIGDVGCPGVLAFEGKPGESPCEPSVVGSELSKRPAVAEMDDDEKALAKKVRMKRLENMLKKEDEEAARLKCGDPVGAGKNACGKGTGLSDVSGENKIQIRSRLIGEMNSLILKLSRDNKTGKVSRGTALYNLKNSKNIKVAYGAEVQRLLYSKKNDEHRALCDAFFEEFKQNTGGKVKPGAKAEAFRKREGIVWKHYDWDTGETKDMV